MGLDKAEEDGYMSENVPPTEEATRIVGRLVDLGARGGLVNIEKAKLGARFNLEEARKRAEAELAGMTFEVKIRLCKEYM